MSGSYNTANLEVNVSSKYQSQQYLRSAAVTSIVHDTLPIEISYLQSQQQLETHHHMTTINVPRATLTSIFKDHMHAVNGFKEYLSETAIVSNDSVAERCLKSPVTNAATHSNKILITNNFAPQQKPVVLQSNQYLREQSERAVHSGNLRLLSASEISALHPSCVYNINSTMNKDLSKDKFLHLQQFTTPQKQFCQQKKQLLAHPAHFVTQQQVLHVQSTRPSHYVQSQFSQQQHSLHQFYSPSEDDTNRCTTNGKVLPITNTISTIVPNPTVCAVSTSATNSTVVLDRINICINNHRMNDGTVASTAASPTSTTISTIPPRQLSPIIPEIEHKAVAKSESGPVIDLHASNDSINTVIDEPDSTTTTPHTPPTTPKNVQVIDTASAANVYSPTRKTLTKCFTVTVSGENVKAAKAKQNLIEASTYQNLSKAQKFFQQQIANNGIQVKDQIKTKDHREIQTIQDIFVAQTPTTPSESAKFTFAIGEDVLVKRADTRFYLGTIIKTDSQKLLVRFDDNSELWTTVDEIRKLCGGKNSQKGQMCVSCKKCVIAEVVEICERCGRGYHRSCTNETSSGSGYWMCKRCEKPMKILETSISLDQRMKSLCQLPYDWIDMSEEKFKDKIKHTLYTHHEHIISGKEIKKDPLYYAPHLNVIPILPKINIRPNDKQLTPLKGAPKNRLNTEKVEVDQRWEDMIVSDINEFRLEDEDERFTSDDEIPIKHIMEKVRKLKTPHTSAIKACHQKFRSNNVEKMDIDDFNDDSCNSIIPSQTKYSLKKKGWKTHKTDSQSITENQIHSKRIDSKRDGPTKSSRKRKIFIVPEIFKETVVEADNRISYSSSDENSSSSRSTSLDLIIPPPNNFLGINNPFLMITPRKCAGKTVRSTSRRSNVENRVLATGILDFSSKLAALKNSGIFSNMSSSELAKAAGQPRLVRTIKRKLSPKDIAIGPNQEVRRRRIRRPCSNVEVISTTTINPIPTNFIPVYAKDSNSAPRNHKRDPSSQQINTDSSNNNNLPSAHFPASQSNTDFVSLAATSTSQATKPTYGRRLRQRPEKLSLYASRRGSISGVSTSSNSSTLSTGAAVVPRTCAYILDLKQSVTKYFGAANRIESGEIFSIRAKRRLADGQMQYLIEWGTDVPTS